jgi:hypothetical protein
MNMAFSGMNSREKTLIAALGVVIVIALIGIGLLLARLLTGEGGQGAEVVITPPPATIESSASGPQETATLVTNPDPEAAADLPDVPDSGQPLAVVRVESSAPLLPAILTEQPLRPGRSYRIEIAAIDGSQVAIRGSWSQAARGGDGSLELPLPESIEGTTPYNIALDPPLANPTSWSCSVSVGPRDLLGQPPKLVITIWDETANE